MKEEKRKLIFTKSGFGVKKISKSAIRRNYKAILQIAKQALRKNEE